MALEGVSDGFIRNVPHLERLVSAPQTERRLDTYADQFVFSSGGQITTIRAKAYTSDVQIPLFIYRVILELADFLASIDIVYLSGSIATRRHILAILAETHTAHDAFVQKIMKQLDIKNSG
jgi:hypothetical protein